MRTSTVLLIDGDADSIAIYSIILRHNGFSVIQATDPQTGLELALRERPDVVIADLFLPARTSRELVDRLRSDDRLADSSLILLDSSPFRLAEFAKGAGSISRLTKPCEPSRLLSEVQRALADRAPVTR